MLANWRLTLGWIVFIHIDPSSCIFCPYVCVFSISKVVNIIVTIWVLIFPTNFSDSFKRIYSSDCANVFLYSLMPKYTTSLNWKFNLKFRKPDCEQWKSRTHSLFFFQSIQNTAIFQNFQITADFTQILLFQFLTQNEVNHTAEYIPNS